MSGLILPNQLKQISSDAEMAKMDEERARAALEGKSSVEKLPTTVKGGKFAVQAAATANEASARELAERLAAALAAGIESARIGARRPERDVVKYAALDHQFRRA